MDVDNVVVEDHDVQDNEENVNDDDNDISSDRRILSFFIIIGKFVEITFSGSGGGIDDGDEDPITHGAKAKPYNKLCKDFWEVINISMPYPRQQDENSEENGCSKRPCHH
jgi:hypothetical protein